MRLVTVLVAAIALTPFCASLNADAQSPAKMHRVGVLVLPPVSAARAVVPFVEGLRRLGYIEGRNIVFEYRSAEHHPERLPALATELVRLNVDVIYAPAVAALAAKNATQTIPIVFTDASDPVHAGLVASLARPGGNLTGLTNTAPDLSAKRLELLREVVPTLSRVAVLWNATNYAVARQIPETEVAARALKIHAQVVAVRGPSDFEAAFSTIATQRAGGLVLIADVFMMGHLEQITTLAAKNRLPAISEFREFAVAGGLMAYGPSIRDAASRAAAYVDKILKGTKPADLPVEQPTKYDLVINLKAARALDLTIPRSVLLRADQVLE